MHIKTLGLAAPLLLALSTATQAVDTTFSGTLTNEQTYLRPELPRPFEGVYPVAQWTAGTTKFNYLTRTFIPGGSGTYSIAVTDTAIGDPMLFVYTPTFDPASPLTSGVVANDDINVSAGDLRARITGAQLTGGQTYIIVVTSYEPGLTGDFTFVISGDYGARIVYLTTLANPLDQGTARMLEDVFGGTASADMKNVVDRLMRMSDAEIKTILSRLTPQSGTALRTLALDSTDGVQDAVDSRLGQYGTGSGSSTADSESTAPAPLNNFWARALGRYSQHSSEDGFAGYQTRSAGLALGLDRSLGSGLVLGDAIALSGGKATLRSYRNGDSLKVKSYQTTVYALKDFGRWYAQGSITGALHEFDSTRDTLLTGKAKADFNGSQLGAKLGAGMPFRLGRFSVIPSAAFECSRLWTRNYTETGAGVMALSVRSANQSRARSSLGGRVIMSFAHAGMTITPFAHAYWQHDFTVRTSNVVANYVGGDEEFTTPGQSLDRDRLNAGLGISVTKDRFYAEASYAADVDRSSNAHSVQAGIGLRF